MGPGIHLSYHFSLWVARSVTCRVGFEIQTKLCICNYVTESQDKNYFVSTGFYILLIYPAILLTGMCFYQTFCTLPFYMDIAFLCLLEYKQCVLTPSQQRSVIFVIFIFGFSRYSSDDFEPV